MFNKIDLFVSSYDTAWVAMVPSPNCSKEPFFPECLTWLLDNQLPDGSWGIPNLHPLSTKDALLSTLACILALKQWSVGEELINKGTFIFCYQSFLHWSWITSHVLLGLHFVESNLASATDEKQPSPVGFDIIFPSMIESAMTLNVNLPLGGSTLEALVQRREIELQRYIFHFPSWNLLVLISYLSFSYYLACLIKPTELNMLVWLSYQW